LRFAMPKAAARELKRCPHLVSLHRRILNLPRISAYLGSDRRSPFNQEGIFRHYASLDH
jgi:glutathione S-transferase